MVLACACASAACSVLTGYSDLRFDPSEGDAGGRDSGSREGGQEGGLDASGLDGGSDGARLDGSLPASCVEGLLDCDGDGACETDSRSDRDGCGACGVSCGEDEGCYAGECAGVADVAMSRGGHHTCALLATGSVVCWGSNAYAQLGDGTFVDRGAPVRVANLPGAATAVAAGATSACAVVAGGVWCWGFGPSGELGTAAAPLRPEPTEPVPGLPDAIAIGAGIGHYCVVRAGAGGVVCWGRNDRGQLGDGSLEDRTSPVEATGVVGAIDVVAGLTHSCALSSDGLVLCWGQNDVAQTGTVGGEDVTSMPTLVPSVDAVVRISAGAAHTCAVRSDGKVRCWGYGGFGQLGREPIEVSGDPDEVTGLRDAVAVAAGRDFTCAATMSGALHCWGQSAEGQLALPGRTEPSHLALPVPDLAEVSAVFAGERSACAVLKSNRLLCWGADDAGALGRGRVMQQPSPARVAGLAGVRTLAVGLEHACALGSGGSVSCWGANQGLQLGNATDHGSSVPRPTAPAPTDYGAIVAGAAHTCALRAGGAVDCWGTNDQRQLGVATPPAAPAPAVTPMLASGMLSIAAGHYHTCARDAANELVCWGANASGQIGVGESLGGELPRRIPDATATGSIDGSDSTTCFVSSGTVQCLGDNSFGQLGDGTTIARSMRAPVLGIDDAAMVATGQGFACAVRLSGTIECWGLNSRGELGTGEPSAPIPTPVGVRGVTGAAGVVAGSGHACAWLRDDGRVLCWGNNRHGQLGDGTFEDRAAPVEVLGLEGVEALGAGRDSTCALRSGEIFCWGARAWGKLGDGTPLFDARPGPVAGSL